MSQQKNEKKREREGIEYEKSWEKEGFEMKLKPIDNKTWAHHILPGARRGVTYSRKGSAACYY